MKRVLAIPLALALLLAAPSAFAARPNFIVAGDGPYTFGQSVPTFDLVADWAAKRGDPGSRWARIDCIADSGTGGLAQYQSLESTTQQGGWKLGPTPSWSEGGASCVLALVFFDNGIQRTIATDTFEVGA